MHTHAHSRTPITHPRPPSPTPCFRLPLQGHVFFSAHGLPAKYIDELGDPYKQQIEANAKFVMQRLHATGYGNNWTLAYQSRVGPVEWLRPYTDDTIRQLCDEGVDALVVVPISFVSEHIETLEEIDMEYRELAEECGVKHWERVPCLQLEQDFIDDLVSPAQLRGPRRLGGASARLPGLLGLTLHRSWRRCAAVWPAEPLSAQWEGGCRAAVRPGQGRLILRRAPPQASAVVESLPKMDERPLQAEPPPRTPHTARSRTLYRPRPRPSQRPSPRPSQRPFPKPQTLSPKPGAISSQEINEGRPVSLRVVNDLIELKTKESTIEYGPVKYQQQPRMGLTPRAELINGRTPQHGHTRPSCQAPGARRQSRALAAARGALALCTRRPSRALDQSCLAYRCV